MKEKGDRQEEDLKKFYMPNHDDFGVDAFEDYGILTYVDDAGHMHEEKIESERGDYGRVYDAFYDAIVYGTAVRVSDEQMLWVMETLETGAKIPLEM